MNIQSQQPQDIKPVTSAVSAETPPTPAETRVVTPQPEVSPAPIAPEATPTTPEVDHLSNVAQPVLSDDATVAVDPAGVTDSAISDPSPIVEPEVTNEDELDKKYFKAADDAIDAFKEKPFEEEEKAEDLTIGYVKDRFGKELHKSDDS